MIYLQPLTLWNLSLGKVFHRIRKHVLKAIGGTYYTWKIEGRLATNANITIPYNSKKHKRSYCSRKSAKLSKLVTSDVPFDKRAVGLCVSMEFFDNDSDEITTWYKGTVISYSRRGYIVTFNGFEPEENEVVKSLKKAMDMEELKIL